LFCGYYILLYPLCIIIVMFGGCFLLFYVLISLSPKFLFSVLVRGFAGVSSGLWLDAPFKK
jgi:hypothetical protein